MSSHPYHRCPRFLGVTTLARSTLATRLINTVAWIAFTLTAACAQAADWRYSIGIHDFVVDDVDSHTYGVTGGIYGTEVTDSGKHYFGSLQVSWDHDQDHLDSDHIPIWWQLHLGADGAFRQDSKLTLGWTADLNTRINTVSSIEREIQALPALVASYEGDTLQASAKAGAGYFFLEIDDDAPKTRGYGRENLRNTTFAESIAADGAVSLGKIWQLAGRAQGWWDGSEWLQTEYAAELHMAVDNSAKHSEIVLTAEVNEYNLDVYRTDEPLPVLGWDDDLLIKLYFVTAW